MGFVRWWCHCWRQSSNFLSGISYSNLFTFRWMSVRSENLCPFREFFYFGKSQKSEGVKSGEWGGLSNFMMEFLARKSRNPNALCTGALSWWRIHLSGKSPGLFLRTDSRNLVPCQHFQITLLIYRLSLRNEFIVNYPPVIEHVQTCLSTWVCLTQHPSDTLRLYRELNCRTS